MKALHSLLHGGRISGLCAILAVSTVLSSAQAQNENPRPDRQGGGQGGGQGGPGGPGGPGGRGNWDPAQMQQRMMERLREELGFTDETEWKAIQPLVQKVFESRISGAAGMGRLMGPGRRGGNDQGGGGGRRGGFGGSSPEAEALQKTIDDNAPAAQIKDALAKYKASQKAKQEKLEAAQNDLRKVLTVKQEASATLLGLLN